MSETTEMPENEHPTKGFVEDNGADPLHGLLLDPRHVRSDIRLLNHAFKGKGPPAHHIEEIWNRLMLWLRTDGVREIDPESGMMLINDKLGAEISIKSAGMLAKFLKMFVDNEQNALKMIQEQEKAPAGDTYNIVGSIALGQEPLTQDDAKKQIQEILANVKARLGQDSPPAGASNMIDVTPEPAKPSSLDSL